RSLEPRWRTARSSVRDISRTSACAAVRRSPRLPTSRCAPIACASRTVASSSKGRRRETRVKRLTLMRHADARWQDPGLSDLERRLNRRGISAAEAMARRLAELTLVPDLLLVSPARRPRQTGEIVARALSVPERLVMPEEALYLASAADLLKVIQATG